MKQKQREFRHLDNRETSFLSLIYKELQKNSKFSYFEKLFDLGLKSGSSKKKKQPLKQIHAVRKCLPINYLVLIRSLAFNLVTWLLFDHFCISCSMLQIQV